MKKKTMRDKTLQTDPLASEIFQAIGHCQYQRLALYLRHNYNINVTSKDGRNGLFFALDITDDQKRKRMIQFCLEHGVDPLQRESTHGYTILHEVIDRQQLDLFQLLLAEVYGELDWGALDARGRTILHQAVESNNATILEALVSVMNRFKVSVDISDKNGLTPYLLAVKLHLPEMANILLNKGHASRRQSDLQMHRTAREWQIAGAKENQSILRKKLRYDMADGKINRVKKLKELYYAPLHASNSDLLRRYSFLSNTTGSGVNHRPINEMLDQLHQGDRPESFFDSRTTDPPPMHLNSLPPIITTTRRPRRLFERNPKYHSLTDLDQIDLLSS
jgi:hypothetical protein